MALKVPITNKYCTCTDEFYNPTHLGHHQKEFETLKLAGMSTKDALDKMGIVRLCCREGVFNSPTLFLNSENEGKIRDEVNHLTSTEGTRRIKLGTYLQASDPIVPKRNVPEL